MIDHVDNPCVGLSGNANTTLSVSGDLTGQVNTPNTTLYQTNLLGFSFPGYVAVNSRPHSSSRLKAESLIFVPNLRY